MDICGAGLLHAGRSAQPLPPRCCVPFVSFLNLRKHPQSWVWRLGSWAGGLRAQPGERKGQLLREGLAERIRASGGTSPQGGLSGGGDKP